MDTALMFRRSDPELYQRVDALDTKVDGIDRLLAAYGVSQKHIEDRLEEWIEVSKQQHVENQRAIRYLTISIFFVATLFKLIPPEFPEFIMKAMGH